MNPDRTKIRKGVLRNGVASQTHATCQTCQQRWTGLGAPMAVTAHARNLGHVVVLERRSVYRYERAPAAAPSQGGDE